MQVAVQDSQGRVVPTASNNVTLEVQGAGVVYRGGGNGDPAEHTSDKRCASSSRLLCLSAFASVCPFVC